MTRRLKTWNEDNASEARLPSVTVNTTSATNDLVVPVLPNPWDRAASMLLLAVWFGLLTGGIEALTVAILYYLDLCGLNLVSPYLWVIPISDAIIFAVPGILLSLLARLRIVPSLLRIATFLLILAFWINLSLALGTMLMKRLSFFATILLAAGLATQLSRIATKYPRQFHRLVMRTTPVFIVTIGIAAVAVAGTDALKRRNMALSTPQASAEAMNVLFIVLDTVRAKSMSLYGFERPTTPNLERWAKQGVVFDRAVSPAPFTLTAHASMFTGLYPQDLSADWTVPLDQDHPTLAEVLHGHGYVTAGIVANTTSCGLQTGLSRGFVHYEAHTLSPIEFLCRASLPRTLFHLPYSNSFNANSISQRFLRFLSERKPVPFFAFLNYFDCHAPYFPEGPISLPHRGYSEQDKLRLIKWMQASFENPDTAGLDFAREAYEASLTELDDAIGVLLDSLETSGELKRTLVIIVGDHGEQFGEHGLVQHSDSLYRPALHVPLMIIDPRSPSAGHRVHEMVTLRDLPATILELLRLPKSNISGNSFAGHMTTPKPGTVQEAPKFAYMGRGPNFPSWHPNSSGPLEAVFADGRYYIRSNHKEELYDFDNDPEEQWNLAEHEAGRPLLEHYRDLLLRRRSFGE